MKHHGERVLSHEKTFPVPHNNGFPSHVDERNKEKLNKYVYSKYSHYQPDLSSPITYLGVNSSLLYQTQFLCLILLSITNWLQKNKITEKK